MHAKNFVLGSGYAYFSPAAGGGERYLGDSPSISLNVTTETLAMFDSDTRIAVKVADVVTQITRVASTTIRSITPENLALFIGGDDSTATQTLSASIVQTTTGAPDRFTQLGSGAGDREITIITVVGAILGAPVLDTDYTVDEALGRIYIPSTTNFGPTEVVTVTYSRTLETWTRVTSADEVGQIGAFRFISNNTYGDERDFYFPLCKITPEGDFALKSRDTPQELTFTIEILAPADGSSAIYIDGRPV